jgi:uncharacterized membrane protein YeaQ/YmgE (transglycosylase-associated protein family)
MGYAPSWRSPESRKELAMAAKVTEKSSITIRIIIGIVAASLYAYFISDEHFNFNIERVSYFITGWFIGEMIVHWIREMR